jgi:hypothetical protein
MIYVSRELQYLDWGSTLEITSNHTLSMPNLTLSPTSAPPPSHEHNNTTNLTVSLPQWRHCHLQLRWGTDQIDTTVSTSFPHDIYYILAPKRDHHPSLVHASPSSSPADHHGERIGNAIPVGFLPNPIPSVHLSLLCFKMKWTGATQWGATTCPYSDPSDPNQMSSAYRA